jgi:hypothetical protein
MVIVEKLVEWRLAGETEVLGENLLQRHFVHHKSHMTRPGFEHGPPRWANVGIIRRWSHDPFLPHPFLFIILLSSYHSTLYGQAVGNAGLQTTRKTTDIFPTRRCGPYASEVKTVLHQTTSYQANCYSERVSRGFPWSLQANTGMVKVKKKVKLSPCLTN